MSRYILSYTGRTSSGVCCTMRWPWSAMWHWIFPTSKKKRLIFFSSQTSEAMDMPNTLIWSLHSVYMYYNLMLLYSLDLYVTCILKSSHRQVYLSMEEGCSSQREKCWTLLSLKGRHSQVAVVWPLARCPSLPTHFNFRLQNKGGEEMVSRHSFSWISRSLQMMNILFPSRDWLYTEQQGSDIWKRVVSHSATL